jgi:hypothetical protein
VRFRSHSPPSTAPSANARTIATKNVPAFIVTLVLHTYDLHTGLTPAA